MTSIEPHTRSQGLGRIFVSGPMRGIPNCNYARFDAAARRLREDGWTVVNPVDIGRKYGTAEYLVTHPAVLSACMKEDVDSLAGCDAIYLLRGWHMSEGARGELVEAIRLGLRIFLEDV